MNSPRRLGTQTRRSIALPALSPLAVALLLGACGGQGADTGADPIVTDAAPPRLATGAAQLANDEVTTLHDAIVLAAARETAASSSAPAVAAATPAPVSVPTPTPGTLPDIATGPDADVPTSVPTTDAGGEAVPMPESAPSALPATSAPGTLESSSTASDVERGPDPSPAIGTRDPASTTASDTPPATEPAPASAPDREPTTGREIEEAPAREPVAEPAEGPVPTSAPEPAEESAEEPAEGPAPASEPESAEEPVRGSSAEEPPVDEARTSPTDEASTEPAREPIDEPTDEPVVDSGTSEPDDASDSPADSSTAPDGAGADGDGSAADEDVEAGDETSPREFEAARVPGFRGRVLDDGRVHVTWPAVDGASGYNVFRNSEFLASVQDAEIFDEDVVDRDYLYKTQAYFGSGSFAPSISGLTVKVRGTGRPDPDAVAPQTGFLDDYALVFADEFDAGPLDATKWNTRLLWGPELTINSEEQYYVDILNEPDFGYDPFAFEDGKLVIEAVEVPDALRDKMSDNPQADRLGYLSGIITSYDSLQFTYGYAEIRARVPYGQGYWPAFWLLNEKYDKDWPEIDIMEFIGDDEDVVYHTYHYYDDDHVLRSTPSQPTKGVDWTAEFHTYAVDWRPGLIVYYVDDVEVHRVSDPRVSRENMYVIANLAMGGWWAGSPDETTPIPGRYEIDYIRVYRQVAPYEEAPLSDGESAIERGDEVLGASPGHRSPFAPGEVSAP